LSAFTGYSVIAEYMADGNIEEINITQQPGIHYLISPNDIGAHKIYSVDNSGTVLKEVYGDDKFIAEKKKLLE
jgi:hypothetical protein